MGTSSCCSGRALTTGCRGLAASTVFFETTPVCDLVLFFWGSVTGRQHTEPERWVGIRLNIMGKKELVDNAEKDFIVSQYSELSNEIRFVKQQMMTGTTQIFALFAGIFATYKFWPWSQKALPIFSAFLLLIAGWLFLYFCCRSMKNSIVRIKHLRCNYFPLFCKMEKALRTNNLIKDPKSFTSKFANYFYYIIILSAFLIVSARIWN